MRTVFWGLVCGMLAWWGNDARADIVLTIDATNPGATLFSATQGLSGLTYAVPGSTLRIVDFPPGANESVFIGANTLRLAANNQTFIIAGRNPTTFVLFLGAATMTFNSGQQALAGSAIVDLSSPGWGLPIASQTGDLRIFDLNGNDTGLIVGQYSITVVPEPSSLALASLGSIMIAMSLRFFRIGHGTRLRSQTMSAISS